MPMRETTRTAFNRYLERLSQLNSISQESVIKGFTVAPSVQQTLEDRMQESSDFLGRVNMFGVTELKGEKIGLSMSGPIAGRTNTSQAARQPRNPVELDSEGYECKKTDFDTFIPYALLDQWAKFPDFETRIRNHIVLQQARDRIMIGFNGTSAAATTNKEANPLLQDVNIGWLQKLRTEKPAAVMTGPTVGTSSGADYRNLDALVFDMIAELIDPWFREDTGLVAIVGRELLHDKYFPIVNGAASDAPTEQLARDVILSTKRLGGLPAVSVPFFPPRGLLVTTLDNLSLYWQEGARRRHVKEVPERDRIETYESSNDAYVVEELGHAALADQIDLVEA
ncbi:MAG: phage major capsid protein, P2 family [Sphingomonadales bacterium]|jgi:P2 family phage major capsid protein